MAAEVDRRGGGGRDERDHRGGWELWAAEVERQIKMPIWGSAGKHPCRRLSTATGQREGGEAKPSEAAEGDQGRGRSCAFCVFVF